MQHHDISYVVFVTLLIGLITRVLDSWLGSYQQLLDSFTCSLHSSWIFSIPIPITFSSLFPAHLHQPNPSKMVLISFATNVFSGRSLLSTSPPFRTKSSCQYNPWINLKPIPKKQQPLRVDQVLGGSLSPLSDQGLRQRGFSSNRRRLSPVVLAAPESTEPRGEDRRAVETVQKLYIAIKNKNIKEVSELIGDECRCFCDFVWASQPFNGKKVSDQVMTPSFLDFKTRFGIDLYL